MKVTSRTLAALGAAGAIAFAGCGDDGADDQTAATGNGVDRAFVADMVPHHQSAVEMAKIAQRRASGDFVAALADDIVRTQTAEIATLRREDAALADAGVKRGSLGVPEHAMGMDGDPSMLEDAKPFEGPFMRMMIAHHQGAIAMATAELARGKDPELQALARAIITAQSREIKAMRAELEQSGGSMGESMEHSG